jgi:hypothetical protein
MSYAAFASLHPWQFKSRKAMLIIAIAVFLLTHLQAKDSVKSGYLSLSGDTSNGF